MDGDGKSLAKPTGNGEDVSPSVESLPEAIEGELIAAGVQPGVVGQVAVRIVRHVQSQFHSGPLPPADTYARYEEIYPGAAKEIMDMAVRAQLHAQDIERKIVSGEIRYRAIGISVAALIVISMIGGAIYCASLGATWIGSTLGAVAGLTTVAGVFIRGRRLFHDEEAVEEVEQREKAPPKSTKANRQQQRATRGRKGRR